MIRPLLLLLILAPVPALAGSLVAARTLPAGTILTADDLRTTEAADQLIPPGFIGLQTRQTIYEGRAIAASQLTAPTLVDRNQSVTIAYESRFLRIEAEGRALSAGSLGQMIRVMNNNSRMVVSGRVAADGTVLVHKN